MDVLSRIVESPVKAGAEADLPLPSPCSYDGEDIVIEPRWAEGRVEQLPDGENLTGDETHRELLKEAISGLARVAFLGDAAVSTSPELSRAWDEQQARVLAPPPTSTPRSRPRDGRAPRRCWSERCRRRSDEPARARAAELPITQCGSNLPFDEAEDASAQIDSRDVLMAAGFGHDVHVHETWFPPSRPDQ
jgi:hypothetical protein